MLNMRKNKKSYYDSNQVKVFKMPAETFLDLCNDYPDYRRFLLLRATMRRTHFLKVFQELKHTKELYLKKDLDSEERLAARDELDVFGV